jgi:hypothetical protein
MSSLASLPSSALITVTIMIGMVAFYFTAYLELNKRQGSALPHRVRRLPPTFGRDRRDELPGAVRVRSEPKA